MAKAPAAEAEAPPAAEKKKGAPWLAISIAIVVSIAASVGGSFFLMRSLIDDAKPAAEGEAAEAEAAEKDEPKLPPNYVPLDPAFVVNLDAPGESRFLQVQVQLMTRDPKHTDAIKLHEPQIRNALLLLFSQQRPEDIASRPGVERLQATALAEVQRIMTAETGAATVEALYFTSFVAQ